MELPKIKTYVEACCRPFFKAWEQMMDKKIADIKEELKAEYTAEISEQLTIAYEERFVEMEDQIAIMDSRIQTLEDEVLVR